MGEPGHAVAITHDPTKAAASHELRCETCGPIGTADDQELASILARFHEGLEARVIEHELVAP